MAVRTQVVYINNNQWPLRQDHCSKLRCCKLYPIHIYELSYEINTAVLSRTQAPVLSFQSHHGRIIIVLVQSTSADTAPLSWLSLRHRAGHLTHGGAHTSCRYPSRARNSRPGPSFGTCMPGCRHASACLRTWAARRRWTVANHGPDSNLSLAMLPSKRPSRCVSHRPMDWRRNFRRWSLDAPVIMMESAHDFQRRSRISAAVSRQRTPRRRDRPERQTQQPVWLLIHITTT
jgi:hypothetical protein